MSVNLDDGHKVNCLLSQRNPCGGDIVMPLWFCAYIHPSVDLLNTIETTPLHVSLSNLADMLTMIRG